MAALGITWILDGLEATLGSALGGILKDPKISLGLSDGQIGLSATIYLVGLICRGWAPESPRWLVTHGRAPEAKKNDRSRGENGYR